MGYGTSGFPVFHHLQEFAQIHVHWVGDTIESSYPLPPPSPFAFNPSQHQGLFYSEPTLCIRWPKYWSFTFSISTSSEYSELTPLGLTGLISCCPRDSHESYPAPQFKGINSSALSPLYGPTLTSIYDYWKNHSFDYIDLCQQSDGFAL